MQPGILIIEENHRLAEELSGAFRSLGHAVHLESDGSRALQAARTLEPALILMEIELPGLDGLQICRELKADPRLAATSVVIVTSRCSEMDQIAGLSQGADDYMTKPFSPKELMLRVKNLLKRSQKQTSGSVLECGPFRFVKGSLLFYLDGEQVDLTATEFKLMLYLCERANVVQNRADLLVEVMGYSDDVHSRTLDTHMKRLRRKLGGYIDLLETVRGIGYQVTIVSK